MEVFSGKIILKWYIIWKTSSQTGQFDTHLVQFEGRPLTALPPNSPTSANSLVRWKGRLAQMACKREPLNQGQHILQTFKRLHSDAFEWGQKTSKTDKATKPNKMVVASTKYAVLVWNPDSETSCFCFNIYMAEAHPSLCQARCHEGISILDQLMVTDHLEVSKISPKIWFYMVLLCKVPPFWEAGMTLDMMFLPVFQKSPLHKYGSPMRVPPDSSAQKFWMTSICKCRVRFQTEKIAVKCQIC